MLLPSLCRPCGKSALLIRFVAISILVLLISAPSLAQTQQHFLFATQGVNGEFTGIAVFVRNDQTGNLAEVTNSPFTVIHSLHCTVGVIDPKGRFDYGVCGLGASGSPFAVSTNTNSIYLVAEATGQYVYVLKASTTTSSSTTGTVLLDTFQVDPTGMQLVALTSQQIQLDGALASVAATQHGFYLFVNQNQNTNFPTTELEAILFDPASGQPSLVQPLLNLGMSAQRLLLDTRGKNLVLTSGQSCANLWFVSISPIDGSVTQTATASLDCGISASLLPSILPAIFFTPSSAIPQACTSLILAPVSNSLRLRFPPASNPKSEARLIPRGPTPISQALPRILVFPFLESTPPPATPCYPPPSPLHCFPAESCLSVPRPLM
jgi:hypothetical protein